MKTIILKQDLVIPAGTVLSHGPEEISQNPRFNYEAVVDTKGAIKDSYFGLTLSFDEKEAANNPLFGFVDNEAAALGE